METNYDIRKFNFILSKIEEYKDKYNLSNSQNGFYIFVLDKFFSNYEYEISENITDSNFFDEDLMEWKKWWRDHWIDVILEKRNKNKIIYKFLNFKFTEKFNVAQKNFKWSELDKINTFLSRVKKIDKTILNEDINENLKNFILDIFDKLNNKKFDIEFEVVLVSNYYNWLTLEDKKRFNNLFEEENKEEITLNKIIEYELTDYNKINANIRIHSNDFIELSQWNSIRSVITKLDANELLRICMNSSEIRKDTQIDDFSELLKYSLEKNIFEENVRIYLNENRKNEINNKIIKTAISEEDKWNFFYFNNWVTIVCNNYSCPKNKKNTKSPKDTWWSTLELEQIQVVNWQQTIYSLFEALKQEKNNNLDVNVLCRFYEVKDKNIREKIAEYTNRQNSIKTRDLRSVDDIQTIIQKELNSKYNILYERKKNEFYKEKELEKIDSEKAWQIILSFFLENPTEAKNKKSIIFWEQYENIFWWDYWYKEIYIWNEIYKFIIENRKNIVKELNKNFKNWKINNLEFEKASYIKHCDLFLLYVIKKILDKEKIEIKEENLEIIKWKYNEAVKIVEQMVNEEFFDKEGNQIKFLLYWPFFKNKSSIDRFSEVFYSNKD